MTQKQGESEGSEAKPPWLHEMFGVPPLSEPFSALYGWPRWWWAYVLALGLVVAGAMIWGLKSKTALDVAEAARLVAEAPHKELAEMRAELARVRATLQALEEQVVAARKLEREAIERWHVERVDAAKSLQSCWQTAAKTARAEWAAQ